MYQQFYGLGESPFSLLPDPDFLYLSAKHRTALDMLELSVYNQSGFCVISGEIGAGKTTLIRELLTRLDQRVSVGLVSNTHPSFGELLQWVTAAFGLTLDSADQLELHKQFIDFVIAQYARNRHTLLIVDEAQNLSIDALEELRMLSNVNSDKDFVLQIMLVGQPQLRDKLRDPALRQFAQRIALDYHLAKLDEEETAAYIRHRLQHAGAGPDLFSDAACRAVARHTQGTPRLINRLCDLALVYGFSAQRTQIDADTIEQVAKDGHLGVIAGLHGSAYSDEPAPAEPEPRELHDRAGRKPVVEAQPAEQPAPGAPSTIPQHPAETPQQKQETADATPQQNQETAATQPDTTLQQSQETAETQTDTTPPQSQETAETQTDTTPPQSQETAETQPEATSQTNQPESAPLSTPETRREEAVTPRKPAAGTFATPAGGEAQPEAESEDGTAGTDLELRRLVIENLRHAQQPRERHTTRNLLWVLLVLIVGGAAGGGWMTRDRWVEPARIVMQDVSALATAAGHGLVITGKVAAVQVSALLARAEQALRTLQQAQPAAPPVAVSERDTPEAPDRPVPATEVSVMTVPEQPRSSSDAPDPEQAAVEIQPSATNGVPEAEHQPPSDAAPATDEPATRAAVLPVLADEQAAELKREAEQLEQLRLNAQKLAREREAAERRLAQEQAARKAAERQARIERERLQTAQAAARRARAERQAQEAAAARAAEARAAAAKAAEERAAAARTAVAPAPKTGTADTAAVLPVVDTRTVAAPAVTAAAPSNPDAAASRPSVAVADENGAAAADKGNVEFSVNPCNGPTARFLSTCR